MKIIRKIALAELRYLFYSPVAWFVVLVFYVLSAAFFFDWLSKMASGLDSGMELIDNYPGWISGIINGMSFEAIRPLLKYLYMFLPLLTMGIINREINSGAIKLLYSSPVRNREIVLGKYLGIVLFNLILLSGSALLLTTAAILIEVIYLPTIFAFWLLFFLLVNVYAAIGLFFSSLTNYQIVAAVLTFVVVFILDSIGDFGQKYDIIRDMTYFLSIKYSTYELLRGSVSSKNILFFVAIISMFLLFAMIRIKSIRESRNWQNTAVQYVFVFIGVLIIGYFISKPTWIVYKDLTKGQTNTLHPETQKVISKLDGSPLKITLYVNLFTKFDKFGFPEQRTNYLRHLWGDYLRFYPNIEFDYVYYYGIKEGDSTLYKQYPGKNVDEIAALRAETYNVRKSIFMPVSSVDNKEALEEVGFNTIMKIEYQGKHTWLRTVGGGGAWPREMNVSGALMRLIRNTDVAVTFLTGNYERSPFRNTPRDFGNNTSLKFVEHSLVDRGVDIDTISLKNDDVPAHVQLLVVADPRVPYTPIELERIKKYIERGGNAMFFAEPGKQFILNPVLEKVGVIVDDGIILKNNKQDRKHIIPGVLTTKSLSMTKELERFLIMEFLGNGLFHNEAASLSYQPVDGFNVEKLISVKGSPDIWIKKGAYIQDTIAPIFNSTEGDIRKDEYVIAVGLSRQIKNKEQRIIVAGDADFMSNKEIEIKKFNHHFYCWALNNEYPIFSYHPNGEDRYLRVDSNQVDVMKKIYLYGLPLLIILFAYGLLMRRRKN